jgi:hypothetical protein
MGWNDSGSMVYIYSKIFKIKKGNTMKTLILFIIAFLIAGIALYADDTRKGLNPNEDNKQEVMKFKPVLRYPANVYRIYKMTEITKVHRLYSDSSTKDFQREVTYFMTLTIPNPAQEGFVTLEANIDSMLYRFTEGKVVIEFNTQADTIKKTGKFIDLEAASVPLNRQFMMTYSPYGDVAKIESEDITWLKDFMAKQEQGTNDWDPLKIFVWNDGLSDQRLEQITDVKKISLPQQAMAKDSIWKSPFSVQIDGKEFTDTVSAKIVDFNAGQFVIEAKTNNLKPVTRESYFYAVKKTGEIDSTKGDGFYIIHISPTGIISKVEAEFSVNNYCKVRFEPFFEQVNSKMTWDYMGQYKL